MITHQEDVDFLEHQGVKGMKWGQRKTQTRQTHMNRSNQQRSGGQKAVDAAGKIARGSLWLASAGIMAVNASFAVSYYNQTHK